jgi:hypothetical protein
MCIFAFSVCHLLVDAAEVHGEAELVVLHHGAWDGFHLGRQRLIHLNIYKYMTGKLVSKSHSILL